MAEEKKENRPYVKRVSDVIHEEISQVEEKDFRKGSEQFEAATARIVERLATDLEYLYDRLFPRRDHDHTDYYDY